MAREYKDSGIEWIGQIPKEWRFCYLKNFFNFEKGKNAQLYTKDYIGTKHGKYPVFSGQTENSGVMGLIDSYDYDVDVNEDDDMVSIITCTRFFEGKKNINFQITGRRVRTEEKINNYKVTKNKNYKEVEEILEKGDEKNEDSSV